MTPQYKFIQKYVRPNETIDIPSNPIALTSDFCLVHGREGRRITFFKSVIESSNHDK